MSLATRRAPTDATVERWEQMVDECIANLPAGGLTPWEATLTRMPRGDAKAMTGRLVDVYRCSGGLLYVFVSRPREEDDVVWQALTGSPDADAVWNDTRSPVFANLSLAEVWEAEAWRSCVSPEPIPSDR